MSSLTSKDEATDVEETASLFDHISDEGSWRHQTQRPSRLQRFHFLVLYIAIFVLSFLSWSLWRYPMDPSMLLFSPANRVVQHEEIVFRKGFSSDTGPYIGRPTDELDRLWDDLYQYGVTIKIPQEDADRLVDKTVPIWNMPGQYMTGLDVFHQLHCVAQNTFRKIAWPEYYGMNVFFPNGTRDEVFTVHYEHCIEHLREAVMCHGDTSALQYVWSEQTQTVQTEMRSRHQCRNFDKIRQWAFDRWVKVDRHRTPFTWLSAKDSDARVA